MARGRTDTRVMPSANVREFFRESLDAALARQRTRADDHTVHYVVNLLTLYTRAEELYADSPETRRLPPLAAMLERAVAAESERDRESALQRLGDVALFMAGFFPDSLARKPVDVDYYIRMGGAAYGALAERPRTGAAALAAIFAELAANFASFVDAIGEISDLGRRYTSRDVIRLYELWLATGSRRARARLDALGVPVASGGGRLRH